jgi:hypothetical protein
MGLVTAALALSSSATDAGDEALRKPTLARIELMKQFSFWTRTQEGRFTSVQRCRLSGFECQSVLTHVHGHGGSRAPTEVLDCDSVGFN